MKNKKLVLIVIPVIIVIIIIASGYSNCEKNPLGLLRTPAHEVTITTDKTEYKPGDTVYVTMKNTGSESVTLPSSSGALIIHLVSDPLYGPISIDQPASRILHPCETIERTIPLVIQNEKEIFVVDPAKPGTYEVSMRYSFEENGKEVFSGLKILIKVTE